LNTSIIPDRRQHLRRSVVSNVQVDHEMLGKIIGSTVNISDTGILLLIDALAQQTFFAESVVKLSLLDSINPEIMFSARVVRNTDHGLAIQLVGYEFQGESYPLSELRRQWQMSQRDLPI